MNDFELFSKYWDNAVCGMVGRICGSDQAVVTKQELNRIWREELLTNRFFATDVPSEAKAFLEDLRGRLPGVAAAVTERLSKSSLNVGMTGTKCAAAASGAAIATAVAVAAEKKIPRGAATLAAAAMTGLAANEVLKATKDQLSKSAAEEAHRQLQDFKPILSGEDGR